MALFQSSYVAAGPKRVPTPEIAGEVMAIRYKYTLPTAQNVTGNIIELGVLPAYCRVVDMILDADDLDTNGTPTLTLDVGIMSGTVGDPDAGRTSGAEFFAASVAGQAGTVVRPTLKGAFRVAPTAADRSIGVKVLVQSATAAAGDIGLTVLVAAGGL